MFPIFDVSGRPIALAGRGMEKDAVPKYLNSPETLLYQKNSVLYGLNSARAAIKKSGYCLVIEGYMDFLTLYQAGIQNAVATSGTALTEEHGNLLHRFTERVVLVFDGDTAGYNAAERAVFVLAPLHLDVRVLVLPPGEDPDSFVRKHGQGPFLGLIKTTFPAVQFLLQSAEKRFDISTATGKSSLVVYCLPFLESFTDPIILATMTKQIAEQLDVKETVINAVIAGKKKKAHLPQPSLPPNFAKHFSETEEGNFLHILIKDPSLIPKVEKHIFIETFSDVFTKNLYSLLIETYTRDKSLDRILDRADNEDARKVLSFMMVQEIAVQNHQDEIDNKVNRFTLKSYTIKMHENRRRLRTEKDPVKKNQLLEELKSISILRGELI
jgi:DNA primase